MSPSASPRARSSRWSANSGSGKTVSALSIMRLLNYPSASHPSGEIIFGGKDLLKAPGHTMRNIRGEKISIIFQEPMTSLNPLHTIEKQVGEVMKLHHGLDDATVRERVLELLRKVGLDHPERRLQAYPHQLSGGQRQRVMIAMALANEPDLLIADEPTTALDVTIQAQILELLKALQRELGMAMLLITHDLGIVRRMADRVYVMSKGAIVEEGRTADVFERPQHPYTRHLMSAEPKGDPPRPAADAPVVLETEDLRVWFPIKRGLLRRTVDYVKAVDGALPQAARGRDGGRGRRVRLRQDDARAGAPAPRLLEGSDRLRRQAHRRPRFAPDAALAQGDADRLPGPLRLAVAAPLGGADHRRGADDPEPRHELGRAPGARRRGAQRGRARPRRAGPLRARVLRRPAPAHRHCARHGAGAQVRAARRAHQRARHVGAGADRRPAARPAAAPRPRLPVHQPRPEGGARACPTTWSC